MKTLRFEDPRSPLERMRRMTLYEFADSHGVRYPQDAPAEVMRQLIASEGLTGCEPPKATVSRYEDMTMPALRRLMKEKGLPQTPKDKKPVLIARLNGNG